MPPIEKKEGLERSIVVLYGLFVAFYGKNIDLIGLESSFSRS